MKLKKEEGDWVQVDLCYEKLPTFCFLYGTLGHGEWYCAKALNKTDANAEKPFGA